MLRIALADHLQKGLNPRPELTHRPRRVDILQAKVVDMDRLVVSLSCRNFKAKRVTVFIDVKNGAFHLELLGVSPDIAETRGDISFERPRLVLPLRLGAVDFP